MPTAEALPHWLADDLAAWAAADLPPYPYRATHPYVSRVLQVLGWINASLDRPLSAWHELRPGMVQAYCKAHTMLKAETLHGYVKALRRWLRWHERDEIERPIISARLGGILPGVKRIEPFVIDDETLARVMQRAAWVFNGSSGLRHDTGGRTRRAYMRHWQPGAFALWLRLGVELGLRPWELAFLRIDEVHLADNPAYIELRDHEMRRKKTPLAGTPLALSAETAALLHNFTRGLHSPWLFAVPDPKRPGMVRAPNYDGIWRALRQELGLPGLNGRVLRRKHASNVARRTGNLFDVMKATRHQISDTLNHYIARNAGRVVDPGTGKVVD